MESFVAVNEAIIGATAIWRPLVDDPDALWQVGVSVWERYTGPYTEDMRPFVEMMLHKRVAVRVEPERIRSWDHRKLGMDPVPVGGSTAEWL